MKKLLYNVLLTGFIMHLAITGFGQTIPLQLDPAAVNQISVTPLTGNTYDILSLGNDPYVFTSAIPQPSYDHRKVYIISFEYLAESGLDDLEIFYGPPITGGNMVSLGRLEATSTWKPFAANMKVLAVNWNEAFSLFRFDFGRQANQALQVRNIVLREPTQEEKDKEALNTNIALSLDLLAKNQMEASLLADGSYEIKTLGGDPFIYINRIADLYDPDSVYIISFEYFAVGGIDELEVFYGPPITGTQKVTMGTVIPSQGWADYSINMKTEAASWKQRYSLLRFDFGRTAGNTFRIRNFSLRKPTPDEIRQEQNSDKVKNEYMQAYLNSTFSNEVTFVSVDQERIHIEGRLSENSSNLHLCELKMYEEVINRTGFSFSMPVTGNSRDFSIDVDRFISINDTLYDRIYSRWVIAGKSGDTFTLASFAHYADDVSAVAKWNLPEEKPLSKKGIGAAGASPDFLADVDALQLHNVTVNVVITQLLSLAPTSLSYQFNGKTYYFNPGFIHSLDHTFKAYADRNVLVSAILLVPRALSEEYKKIFVHPDADNGPYSMANVTTLQSTSYYAAIIAFMSERYSQPDKQYGRITHWILHNEVDAGYYWTNAGRKPMELYTELYDRSMRTVYYTARRFNPTAKVFISLTHFWNSNSAPPLFFAPKAMLTLFNDLSRWQGDYEWGVAYHPYPQDLFEPKTWQDNLISQDLNTSPLITPKNIELMDTWIRSEENLYKGSKVRSLLFSEQGVNSRDYSEQSFREQAAGLAYFWKKLNRLPSLEAFHYHRRTDNSTEGGLQLGLWTVVPGTIETPGYKKPAWYVYEAANTSNEDAAFAFALPLVDVEDWPATFNPLTGDVMPYQTNFTITYLGNPADSVVVKFNGEQRQTHAQGTALFHNVASLSTIRNYKVHKNGRQIMGPGSITVNSDQQIQVDLKPVKNLLAHGITSTQIQLTWEDKADYEKGFVIEVQQDDTGFVITDTVTANTEAYLHEGLISGKKYTYRLYAYADQIQSLPSAPVTALAPYILVSCKDGDNGKTGNNHIRPHIELINEGDQAIDYSQLTLKYWFTAEAYAAMQFSVDYAQLGTNHVKGSFVMPGDAKEKANAYLEIAFGASAGSLPGSSKSGPIQTRINKTTWTNFDETNDYSYSGNAAYRITDNITLYRNGELIWGKEPAPVPASVALKVVYKDGTGGQTSGKQIKPHLQLVNEGYLPVDYKDLHVKYWFTREGTAPMSFGVDYASIGNHLVTGKFVALDSPLEKADHYVEISIDPTAGKLYGLSNSGEMQLRLVKSDWSVFDESNDYSYAQTSGYMPNSNITIYHKGELVWGNEPLSTHTIENTTARKSLEDDKLSWTVYPDQAAKKVYVSYQGQIKNVQQLYLADSRGRSIPFSYQLTGNRIEISLHGVLSSGIYIVRGLINQEIVYKKLAITQSQF